MPFFRKGEKNEPGMFYISSRTVFKSAERGGEKKVSKILNKGGENEMKKLLIAILFLAVLLPVTYSQEAAKPEEVPLISAYKELYDLERFKQIDTNNDGLLSREELKSDQKWFENYKAEARFKHADTNADEMISLEEAKAHRQWELENLEEWLAEHPRIAEFIERHPGLIDELAKHPRAAEYLAQHPQVVDWMEKYPNAARFLIKHPNAARFLHNHPNIEKFLAKHPDARKKLHHAYHRWEKATPEERERFRQKVGKRIERRGEMLERKGEQMQRRGERMQPREEHRQKK